MHDSQRDITVSLSGGGYRATAFALGAMIYIAETRERSRVGSISSVSGGSITNGYLARGGLVQDGSTAEFRDSARRFATRLAQVSINVPRLFIVALSGTALASISILVAGLLAPMSGRLRVAAVVLWVALSFLALLVSLLSVDLLVERRFCELLDEPKRSIFPRRYWIRRWASLSDLARSDDRPTHLFCAKDLEDGRHFYMAPGFVVSARYGSGGSGQITLLSAVRASAGFPGAFPPVRLKKSEVVWHDVRHPHGRILLVDGGVYDNLGTPFDITTATTEGDSELVRFLTPERVSASDLWAGRPRTSVVVNASAVAVERPYGILAGALARTRFGGLVRALGITHAANTTARAQALRRVFELGDTDSEGVARGVVISLDDNPASLYANSGQGSFAALEALRMDTKSWATVVAQNSKIATDLGASVADVERLAFQGYWVARVRCRTELGFYPLDSLGLMPDWLSTGN